MLDPRIVAASTQFFEESRGPEVTATDVSTSLHGMGPQFIDHPPEAYVFKISWINCTAIARSVEMERGRLFLQHTESAWDMETSLGEMPGPKR
jgi:hypothetical protein